MQVLPGGSTVSITSAALMARELLTHSLSGTLVSNTERINCYSDFSQISEERVIQLIEKAFNGKIRDGYLASIKGDIDRIYLSELYHALAIVTRLNGVPYLHKFAVSEEFQMHGLGGRLFEMLQHDYKTLAWRSRVTNVCLPSFSLLSSLFFLSSSFHFPPLGGLITASSHPPIPSFPIIIILSFSRSPSS